MKPSSSYLFDISTSARWTGAPVGIIRVEREVASRMREHVGDNGGYCVYDLNQNIFRHVPDETARAILAGEQVLEFGTPVQAAIQSLASPRMRQKLWNSGRRLLRRNAMVYRTFQKFRGRSFTLSEIEAIQRAEFARAEERSQPIVSAHVNVASLPVVQLSRDVAIISGGLDWEHKRIRHILHLKRAHKFRYIAILYDLIPLLQPHYVVPAYVDLLRDYFGELFWVADQLMCISETTRRDLLEHCARYAIPPPAAEVFPLGGEASAGGQARSALPDQLQGKSYGLFVSTIEPRKNHRVLYEAWDYAMRNGRLNPDIHRLVFVGRIGWAVGDLIAEIATNPAVRDNIVILDRVSDEVLGELYANATVTLFPSHYEGYGLPVAEALAHGKPCIASASGSLSEIGGDLVRRVDPRDTIGWASAMVGALTDPDATRAWAERVKREYRPVSWSDAARAFYRGLDGRRGA